MTPAELDETDLEFLLDMEILDARIDAAFAEQKSSTGNFGKPRPFSGKKFFIDQIPY